MPTPVTRPTAQNLTTRQIVVTASKEKAGVGILRERTKSANLPALQIVEDVAHPARVRTEIAITKNMTNFESMKIGVHIESPCLNTDEQKLATHQHDLPLAMKMLEKEAADVSVEWFD